MSRNAVLRHGVQLTLLIVCCALLLVGARFGIEHTKSAVQVARTITDGTGTFTQLSKRFVEIAQKRGGVFAFDVLRVAQLPPGTDLHLLGHAIGDELYKQRGVSGISDCTQDFRNACSHSIVIGALRDFGEAGLPMIREACKAAPGGPGAYTMCFHGLGHGVFAGYGYSLPETVAFCEKAGTKEHFGNETIQCIGGAIMELVGGGGHNPDAWETARKKYLTSPLAPCMSSLIPESSKEMCLSYLTPELWTRAGIDLQKPDPALFSKAFLFCTHIPHTVQYQRESCFGGFGKEFVGIVAGLDIQHVDTLPDEAYITVGKWCERAVGTDGIKGCIKAAVTSVLWGGENDPRSAVRFCAVQPTALLQDGCYERLSEGISQYIVDTNERASLCGTLPEQYRDVCSGLHRDPTARTPL